MIATGLASRSLDWLLLPRSNFFRGEVCILILTLLGQNQITSKSIRSNFFAAILSKWKAFFTTGYRTATINQSSVLGIWFTSEFIPGFMYCLLCCFISPSSSTITSEPPVAISASLALFSDPNWWQLAPRCYLTTQQFPCSYSTAFP